jgi:hypothetical protein
MMLVSAMFFHIGNRPVSPPLPIIVSVKLIVMMEINYLHIVV